MRIMWFSNAPWARTGYGQQTKIFVPRLKALGHEMAVTAFYGLEGSTLDWNGVPVYPKGAHGYGQDVLAAHSTHFQADICLSLFDSWVFEPAMFRKTRWVPWFPVDHQPIPPLVALKVAESFCPIAYSLFGQREAQKAGIDARYVPHGYEPAKYYPMKPDEARKARELLRFPMDKFLVGMVAANKGSPSRKSLAQSLEAFANFHERHNDTALYLHTVKGEQNEGINLLELIEHLGLRVGSDVLFVDAYANLIGLPEEYLAGVYNAIDVLLSPSMGEGFGVPILEAQACGCPVIVGEWTSMPELFFGGQMIARADSEPFWTPLGSYQFAPHAGAIEAALEHCYQHSHRLTQEQVNKTEPYRAANVTAQYWRPVLDEIEVKVKADAK